MHRNPSEKSFLVDFNCRGKLATKRGYEAVFRRRSRENRRWTDGWSRNSPRFAVMTSYNNSGRVAATRGLSLMEHPRDYESPWRAVSERATDIALLNADECSGELTSRLAPLANPDDNNRRDRWSTTASNRPPVWIGSGDALENRV